MIDWYSISNGMHRLSGKQVSVCLMTIASASLNHQTAVSLGKGNGIMKMSIHILLAVSLDDILIHLVIGV